MRADKQTVTRLLKTARGQLDGILAMVEADRYCMDMSNPVSYTHLDVYKRQRCIQPLSALCLAWARVCCSQSFCSWAFCM